MKFNINNNILVKLNEKGLQHLRDEHTLLCTKLNIPYKYTEPNIDKDGYTKFQMWSFMQKFGPVTRLSQELHYDLEIIIIPFGTNDTEEHH